MTLIFLILVVKWFAVITIIDYRASLYTECRCCAKNGLVVFLKLFLYLLVVLILESWHCVLLKKLMLISTCSMTIWLFMKSILLAVSSSIMRSSSKALGDILSFLCIMCHASKEPTTAHKYYEMLAYGHTCLIHKFNSSEQCKLMINFVNYIFYRWSCSRSFKLPSIQLVWVMVAWQATKSTTMDEGGKWSNRTTKWSIGCCLYAEMSQSDHIQLLLICTGYFNAYTNLYRLLDISGII